jgi:hypothetical protein
MQPRCDEVVCELEAGDRLLLVATGMLIGIPPDDIAGALSASSCEDARDLIAATASLGSVKARWPLTVIEIEP